jgi:hypothetical protein
VKALLKVVTIADLNVVFGFGPLFEEKNKNKLKKNKF